MKENEFISKVFTPDNRIEYVPNEIALVRYSLRYTKLLSYKEIFGRRKRGIK